MPESKSINIALFGIGTIGKRHLLAIDKIDNVKLVGIVDVTKEAEVFCASKNKKIFAYISTICLSDNRPKAYIWG